MSKLVEAGGHGGKAVMALGLDVVANPEEAEIRDMFNTIDVRPPPTHTIVAEIVWVTFLFQALRLLLGSSGLHSSSERVDQQKGPLWTGGRLRHAGVGRDCDAGGGAGQPNDG